MNKRFPEEAAMIHTEVTATTVALGDLITLFYQEYLALYGDEELASVAAAATINDILAQRAARERAAPSEEPSS